MKYKIVQFNHDTQDYDVVIEADLTWDEAHTKLKAIRAKDKVPNPPARCIMPDDVTVAAAVED